VDLPLLTRLRCWLLFVIFLGLEDSSGSRRTSIWPTLRVYDRPSERLKTGAI